MLPFRWRCPCDTANLGPFDGEPDVLNLNTYPVVTRTHICLDAQFSQRTIKPENQSRGARAKKGFDAFSKVAQSQTVFVFHEHAFVSVAHSVDAGETFRNIPDFQKDRQILAATVGDVEGDHALA
jgi:hypothetical protein